MDKKQWETLYNLLSKTYSDFQDSYPDYLHGKNKNIRDKAGRNVISAINRADHHISSRAEVLELLTRLTVNEFAYDEFLQPRYFNNDMRDFLEEIRRKIDSFNVE